MHETYRRGVRARFVLVFYTKSCFRVQSKDQKVEDVLIFWGNLLILYGCFDCTENN